MATTITQTIGENDDVILRIEGEMMIEDALLLEKLAGQMRTHHERDVTIDLADLDFLDSDSAAVLKRLEGREGFALEGLEIFLQSAVDSAERNGA